MAARAEADGTEMGRALASCCGTRRTGAGSQGGRRRRDDRRGAGRLQWSPSPVRPALDSILSAVGLRRASTRSSPRPSTPQRGCSPGKAAEYVDAGPERWPVAAAAGDIGRAWRSPSGRRRLGAGDLRARHGLALGLLGYALDKADRPRDRVGKTEMLAARHRVRRRLRGRGQRRRTTTTRTTTARAGGGPGLDLRPSGYIYEGTRSARIPGVTATLLHGADRRTAVVVWDAEWFGQINPQTTDNDGRYGWDVPEGWWKVAYTKDGYRPASQRVLHVLPPHLDVDVSMVKEGFPHVDRSRRADGRIEVTSTGWCGRRQRSARSPSSTPRAPRCPGTWAATGAATGDATWPSSAGSGSRRPAALPAGSRVTADRRRGRGLQRHG